jgi:hypothetical protein
MVCNVVFYFRRVISISRMFRVSKKIFVLKTCEESDQFWILHNEKLLYLYRPLSAHRSCWTGHPATMYRTRNAHRILVEKSHGRQRRR